ncbi:TfoX/Sxy family DNA transformation protein [Chryseobacterium sp. 52]|nr:TfoX/Sxy family DNA transformation protein [Chryseobacterium sp. 52]
MPLEGAIQNIRWHLLDNHRKQELKNFHKLVSLNK